ncbi:MAG: tRNA 4-thiouridine(8) synthase ThiI [Candidatus Kerfeldbacteria bacterium]|nr:tRNA 4-thiouridine(8) synthase ThiI [Candidatus Kerfeldbacteria bacterium]
MKKVLVIHYGELALKGGNRKLFEKKLEENVRTALTAAEIPHHIQRQYGRMVVEEGVADAFTNEEQIISVIQHVFGISTLAFAYVIHGQYEDIEKTVLQLLAGHDFTTFSVRARRINKQFPMSSEEVNRTLGARIVEEYNKQVQLTNPDIEVRISITTDGQFISFAKQRGAGGLPNGTSGKFISMLSSGIDSPVASFRMMKRGARVFFLHFHSYPMTSRASIENTEEIVQQLQQYQPDSILLLAPLAEMQKAIVRQAPPSFRILLYRKAMFDIAQRLAHLHRAKGVITGESLGQVASQTIENMTAVTQDIRLPVLRPLIGCDKQEIMDEAQRIGTYDISIRPYEDCCSLLVPPSVETRARAEDLRRFQDQLPWEEMIADVIVNTERRVV